MLTMVELETGWKSLQVLRSVTTKEIGVRAKVVLAGVCPICNVGSRYADRDREIEFRSYVK